MKTKITTVFLGLAILASSFTKAQGDSRNVVKLNLFGLALGSFNFQYEYAFHKNMSAALGINFLPSRTLPSQIAGNNEDLKAAQLSGWSITPEFRFYPGKKEEHEAPHGFYLAPYFRYCSFTVSMPKTLQDSAKTVSIPATISLKMTGIGGGLLLGYQWIIKERVSIDWWILGLHGGSGTYPVTVESTAFAQMSDQQRSDLQKDLADIKVPGGESTATVTKSAATVEVTGPYAGFRMGLCIGIAF